MSEQREKSTIVRGGSPAPQDGPADWFAGKVRVDLLTAGNIGNGLSLARVSFAAGGRTAWHKHPAGQTLLVEKGEGWTQVWGGAKEAFKAGDVIWCPPSVKHWHGATAASAMTHVAITPYKNGQNVDWLEQVSDAEYLAEK
ncbi:quercetin dioxygenase Cupin domain protein [Candidatus Termititenax aidoneus]|uniref:Quercetin dioxygenase Cupin domain protein n=1 Tax=Termititenax aidoneus TaxID=2218524 RepID=A0A388TDJ1_TERA1|nr:quercetin dioxygenase Cupin domain protein [Candidatus Termititenax aidoneus]